MRSRRAKNVQLSLYYRYKAEGICWNCKEDPVKEKDGALCAGCIKTTRVKKKHKRNLFLK